nr:M28 family peptidase [Calditrichia bacterium]
NSLTATVYRYLPNDTDFSPFLRAGIPGMNFSIIDNHPAYHNVLDNPANLDLGSLRQTGEAVLGVTRAALAQMPPPHSRPTAYFTLPGGMLIRYPVFVQHLAAVLIVVLWLFLIRIHPDRNEILKRGLFSQILLTVIPLVVIPALLGFLFNQLMPSLFSPEGYRYFYWENPLLAFTMLQALVLQTLFYLRWLTKGLVWEIWLGQLGFLALLNLGLSLWVPEAFFFLTWPLIFILMGTLLSMLLKCFRLGDGHSCLLIAQFAVPGILILLPLIYLVHIALSLHLVAVSLMVAMILSFILLPFWMPILSKHRLFLAFLATISLLGPLLIRFSAKPSADRPQPEYLAYIADSQSPKAFWLARETGSDWQEVFFANRDKVRIPEDLNILWPGQKGLAKAANAVALSGPAAEILQRDSAETTLRLFSTRGAPNMQIQVVRGSIEKIGGPDGRWHAAGAALQAGKTVRFYNLPDSGLVLGGPGGQTLQLSVFDQSYDLPAGAPQLPEGSMHHRTGNATWCRSTFLWAF